MASKAKKNDSNYMVKPPMDLIPGEALMEVARVFGFGATKYGRHNWKAGMEHTRLAAAATRHIYQYLLGLDKDDESELEHLAHATCSLLMLLESRICEYGKDDR